MATATLDGAAVADPQQTVREYVLRMAPPEEQQQHRFLGSFPLGPPGFRERRKGKWALSQQEPAAAPSRGPSSRRQQRPKEWSLEELTSGTAFHGLVEAGMSGGSATAAAGAAAEGAAGSSGAGVNSGAAGCYFLLTRRGNDFVAQPVHEWLTFRPTNARRGSRTLEEAEAAMASRAAGNGIKAMPRLAELAAAGPADEEAMAGGDRGRDSDGEGEGADSDVEGALGRLTTKGSPAAAAAAAAADGKAGGKDAARKPAAGRRPAASRRNERGEDWEYEDDRADDDLEMGKDEDADMPAPRRQGDDSEEEGPQLSGSSDGDAPKPLSSSGAQLQKLLRKTGLDGASDAELSDEEATPLPGAAPNQGFADDQMDDEDDEEFLQNMARQEAARQVPVRQPPVAPKAGGGAVIVKPAVSTQRGKRKGQTDIGDQASTKKAKGSGIATGAAQGALAAAGATPTPEAAASGPPSQAEIVEWLRAAGPVAMGELTRRFKKRLTTDAQRKSFGATIKAIAVHKEVTPGAGKVIMLKPGV